MSLARTIEVIPHVRLVNRATGQTASPYGSHPSGFELDTTSAFTWRVIDHRGGCTIGLCRRPAKTREEADEMARQYVARRPGWRVIGDAA